LDGDLARHKRDYELAWRLERIRLDTATLVEGDFDFGRAEWEYPLAFAEAGLPLEPGRLKETAGLIQQSVIKEQLLAALEHWVLLGVHFWPPREAFPEAKKALKRALALDDTLANVSVV